MATPEPTRESTTEPTLEQQMGSLRVTHSPRRTKKRESTGSVTSVNSHTHFESDEEESESGGVSSVERTEEQKPLDDPGQPSDWVLERKGRSMVLPGRVASRLYPHQRQGAPLAPTYACLVVAWVSLSIVASREMNPALLRTSLGSSQR